MSKKSELEEAYMKGGEPPMKINKEEQADGHSKRGRGYHQYIKKRKNRLERHRANRNPETQPAYGKYAGWET